MTPKIDFHLTDDPANGNGHRSSENLLAIPSDAVDREIAQSARLDDPAEDASPKRGQMMWRSIPHTEVKWQGQTLRRQLLVRILPGVLIPLGLAGILGYSLTAQKAIERARQQLSGQVLIGSEAASEWLEQVDELPELVATNPLVIEEARAAIERVKTEALDTAATEDLEKQFANTLLLKPNQALNDYLKRVAAVGEIAELFFTDKHGFNLAYSSRPSDFVQSDESWWQNTQTGRQQELIPEFDVSANTFSLNITSAIVDPPSQTFLGVVKAVIPATDFHHVLHLVDDSVQFASEEAQVLGISAGEQAIPFATLKGNQVMQLNEVLGGETVAQRASDLVKLVRFGGDNLKKAIREAGFPVNVRRVQHEDQKFEILETQFTHQGRLYLLGTIPDSNWAIAVSVSEAEIAAAGRNAGLLFAGMFLAVGAVVTAIVAAIARQVVKPIDRLVDASDRVASGDLDTRAEVAGTAETRTLAHSFNNLVERVKDLLDRQTAATARSQLVNEIVSQMRRSLQKDEILQTAVDRLRAALNTDRVIVYQFHDNWHGTIIAESVVGRWRKILGETVEDPFREGLIDRYRNGRVRAMNDIDAEGLTDCHRDILEGFQIRASIVAPIIYDDKLVGLLCAHHCAGTRNWEDTEIELFRQISTQVGFALEQAELFAGREQARLEAEALSEEQRKQKESLQMQLLTLLDEVEGASRGDLTVRADVTAGDIGTVADFFNSIIESLRQIVTQVKTSASQVNSALGENETAMRQLTEEALQQAAETTRTLDSVEQMTRSIQAVAQNARRAAEVAKMASNTAESGGVAMDRTVANILNLRETVASTAKKVKQLGESSQQISKVVSLIDQIALQTNLLAINAGIEAARAGEEGQGFAVVAEEVGELAARSANATKEIERIVENIQLETAQVVEAMEQSTAQVVEGTHLVENAKQSLSQIVQVSRQIDELVRSISDSTVSQVQTSETVSNLMKAIAQVSTRTADASSHVSENLRQTVEIAQQLQTSVGTFKVDS
ncbi:MAG TPA: GAF domain-containing protein [Oscillatoriales cyanobacterium M4454_W2019_049]|nr:GAF domain-containing protein [Oscillatoriales cyanobacterium M4454_W2019_049]